VDIQACIRFGWFRIGTFVITVMNIHKICCQLSDQQFVKETLYIADGRGV